MPFEGHLPEPIVSLSSSPDPEQEALLADSLGLAMMVVLDQLAPAERVAFVLHDVFGIAFDEIGEIVGRSPAAARQLASRARRRVRGIAIDQDADIGQQRAAVDAFLAAARAGDMQALLEILDPDVVVRADFGPNRSVTGIVRGAEAVAKQAMSFRALAPFAKPALVNGAPGVVVIRAGRPFAVGALTVSRGRIVELDILGDPERLAQMDLDETVESEGDSA
jgi:RNA polymerase sigma-70 factor (ECF subfamily)